MTTVTVNIPAHTMAFGIEDPTRLAEWLGARHHRAAIDRAQAIGNWLRMPAPTVPEASAPTAAAPAET